MNICSLQIKDYYPFGMAMPGRSFSSSDYRFGFNGKEKDDEVNGNGNSLDFGARIYSNRLCRFITVDLLSKQTPNQSSYVFAGNSPIIYIDENGNFKLKVDDEFSKKTGKTVIDYQSFDKILQMIGSFISDNPKIIDFISAETGLTKEEILEYTEYGKGPTIVIKDDIPFNAIAEVSFKDFSNNEISFNSLDLDLYESKTDETEKASYTYAYAIKTLHELIHFGDRKKNGGQITGLPDNPTGGSQMIRNVPSGDRGTELEKSIFKIINLSGNGLSSDYSGGFNKRDLQTLRKNNSEMNNKKINETLQCTE